MTSDYFFTHTDATEDERREPNVFIIAMSYTIFKIGKSLKIIPTIRNTGDVRRLNKLHVMKVSQGGSWADKILNV